MTAVVQTVVSNGLGGVTNSKTFTLSPTQSGNSIIITMAIEGGSTAWTGATISDNKTNSYSSTDFVLSLFADHSAAIFYVINATAGVTSVTVTTTGGSGGLYGVIAVQEVSGITALDKHAGGNSPSSSPMTLNNSATNTGTADFVTTAIAVGNGASNVGLSNPPTGYTTSAISQNDSTDASGACAYRIDTSAVTDSVTWAATNWEPGDPAVIASFVGSASTGTTLTAASGSYSLSGQAENNKLSLPLAQGSYSLSGQTASLGSNVTLTASFGSYSMTGNGASLDFSSGSAVMVASAGNFALTGASAASDLELAVDFGSFSLTGSAATFAAGGGGILTASTGSFALTGESATLAAGGGSTLPLGVGNFVLNGQAASLASSLGYGVFGLTGSQADLLQGTGVFALTADAGMFFVTGQSVTLPSASTGPGGITVAEGHYRRKKKRLLKQIEPAEPLSIAPASIERVPTQPTLQKIARLIERKPLSDYLDPVDAEIKQLLQQEIERDDEEAISWILRVIDE